MIVISLIALCVIFLIISLFKEKELRDYKQESEHLLADKEDEIFIIGAEYEQLKIKYEKLKKS